MSMADSIQESHEFHFYPLMQVFGRSLLQMRQRSEGICTRKMVPHSNDNWAFVLHMQFVWKSSAAPTWFHLQSIWCSRWSIWFCRKFMYLGIFVVLQRCILMQKLHELFFPVPRHQTSSCKLSRILNWPEDTNFQFAQTELE